MVSTHLLTSEDIDEIGQSSFEAQEPQRVVDELVDAVEGGLLADPADAGYALTLAAEIAERAGHLAAAEELARRGVEECRLHDRDGYPRAFHGEVLLRLDRDDEGMVELAALRPKLTRDEDAVHYLTDALVGGGRPEIAEQWLTAALEPALRRRERLGSQRSDPAYSQAATVAYTLLRRRHHLRRDLGLSHDEHDDLADQVVDAVRTMEEERRSEDIALLFWPRAEFDLLLQRWPTLAEAYGATWDEYRAAMQQGLVRLSDSGCPRLAVLAGSADELAGYASRRHGDPTDPATRQGYAEHLQEHPRETAWPPGRNAACWCGSQGKYKKCCLPRAR